MIIRTDSQYSIDANGVWLFGWKRNGFMTSSGEPVKNQDLIRSIDAMRQHVDVS
jgi:ribonuclease HI